ncbi:GNAT family N-acetyltransferase [Actinospica sp.]|uniref:GNAT family N-acetyltransferase n=1 Tax=Actinospica sp. TaxID=1872142 RepID=UPI002B7B5D48|nr:GNAT family N-acetyltransferase [Actinospica sp.]HWG28843.1 GNAT family N-acetyltransferase [Actinospica sp.]
MGVVVRRASVEDAWELTRLRRVMLKHFQEIHDDLWEYSCKDAFEQALADPDGMIQAFVVDAGDFPGKLAACSIGLIQQRLPSPDNHSGLIGYIQSVSTDPDYRRRGYARAVVESTLEWLDSCGVPKTELTASSMGDDLYRELGFSDLQYGTHLSRWLPAQV